MPFEQQFKLLFGLPININVMISQNLNTIPEVDSDYKEYIQSLAEGKKEPFLNSGPAHASYVFATLFSKAQNNGIIKIYNGGFRGEVSNDDYYQEQLFDFLSRGGTLQILCTQPLSKNTNLFEGLRFYAFLNPKSVVIKQTVKKVLDPVTKKEAHFMVADDLMYRIEEDIINYTAICSFNDPETSMSISNLFDVIFKSEEATLVDMALPKKLEKV